MLRSDASRPPRPSARSSAAIVAAALAVVVGACSAGTSPSTEPSPTSSATPSATPVAHPTGAGDLVLRYEEIGGFVGPQTLLTRYPVVSVYGDGLVITVGAVPAIYPGPALPSLVATRITERGLQRLLAEGAVAGLLGPDAQWDATGIADATTARFTLVAAGTRHVVSAYALGQAGQGMEGSAAAVAARTGLRAFVAKLGDLRSTLGPDDVGSDTAYAFSSIRILVAQGAPQSGDPSISRPPLAWPLATPLATFGKPGTGLSADLRCGVVTGGDLDLLRPLLVQATQITGWSSGGAVYTLFLLPMLPDNQGC